MLFLKNTVAVIGIIVVFLIHVCSVLGCCHHFTICALFDIFLFHVKLNWSSKFNHAGKGV